MPPATANRNLSKDCPIASIGIRFVCHSDGRHAAFGGILGGLPIKGGLNARRPVDLHTRHRQIDRMHGEGQALARGQRISELQLARLAIDRLVG